MANIFFVSHNLLLFHLPKGSWNKSAKYEKLGKYWPYCTRNRAITNPNFKALILAFYCYYCRDNIKYGLFSRNLFQRKQQHGGWENFIGAINFYEKQWLLVLIWNKKHLSKQSVSKTYILEKKFLAAATFKVCEFFLFRHSTKTCIYFDLHEFFSYN